MKAINWNFEIDFMRCLNPLIDVEVERRLIMTLRGKLEQECDKLRKDCLAVDEDCRADDMNGDELIELASKQNRYDCFLNNKDDHRAALAKIDLLDKMITEVSGRYQNE